MMAARVIALIGLSQASAALTLGVLGGIHPAAALLVFCLSWTAYVESSERARPDWQVRP